VQERMSKPSALSETCPAPEPQSSISVSLTETVDTSFLYEELRRKYKSGNYQPLLVNFRQLVSWTKVGDQLTHQIHPYPAKLLSSIAHFFSRASSVVKPGSNLLDPFCGSGTVALEASLAGHRPLVCDANPLSLLITKVKTATYDTQRLRELTHSIIKRAAAIRSAPEQDIVNSHLWYDPKRKKSLERLLRAISELEDEKDRDFFNICFSIVARKLSYADPSISVPVRLKQKASFSESVSSRIEARLNWIASACTRTEFGKICDANITRFEKTQSAFSARMQAIHVADDARKLCETGSEFEQAIAPASVHMVITSPPYGSAQKYIRATSLSLNWLGLSKPSGLASLEAKSIGREHAPGKCSAIIPTMPHEFEALLLRVKKKNSLRHEITLQYLTDMQKALGEISRAISPNGHAVIVLGNNQVCGEVLRNDIYCISILESCGMKLEMHLVDNIKSRSLLLKRNSSAPAISRESILVFSKPMDCSNK
jgi:tRNA G10  N-methylase Trm11